MSNTDMWDESDVSAFELPGDSERLAVIEESAEAPATESRPRDPETGRFTAQEQAQEQEPAPEAPQETPAEETPSPDDPIQKLLAKYGGDERKALEAALEAQRTIGSLNQELGTLRERAGRADQYEQYLRQLQAQPQDWDEMIEERPDEAAMRAFAYAQQTNDWRNYQRAAEAWNEVAPGAPLIWEQQQQLLAQAARIEEYVQQQTLGQKIAEVENQIGTLDESLVEVLPRFPFIARMLADPQAAPEQKAEALLALGLAKRGLDTGTLAQQAQETARKLAEDEQRAVDEASVITATRTNPQQPKSAAALISEEWWEDERRSNEGWNLG